MIREITCSSMAEMKMSSTRIKHNVLISSSMAEMNVELRSVSSSLVAEMKMSNRRNSRICLFLQILLSQVQMAEKKTSN